MDVGHDGNMAVNERHSRHIHQLFFCLPLQRHSFYPGFNGNAFGGFDDIKIFIRHNAILASSNIEVIAPLRHLITDEYTMVQNQLAKFKLYDDLMRIGRTKVAANY